MDNQTGTERQPARAPLSETPAFLIAIGACVICAAYWLLLIKVYHFTNRQAVELAAYLLSVVAILVAGVDFTLPADPGGNNVECNRRSSWLRRGTNDWLTRLGRRARSCSATTSTVIRGCGRIECV